MRNLTSLIGTLTNDADGICESQAGTEGVALTLDGALVADGVVALTYAQPVTVTSAGNDSGITFEIVGKDPDGTAISITLTGGNTTTATTSAAFSEVSSITPSGDTAADVTVGVVASNGATGRSLRVNGQQKDFKVGLFVDVISGTLTYSAQYAYQQPEDSYDDSYSISADWRNVDGLSALTADDESNLFYKVNAVRLKVTSYTSGSVRLTATQSY